MNLQKSLDSWLVHEARQGRLRRDTSVAIYRAMWQSLCRWATVQHPAVNDVQALTPTLLATYIAERERTAHAGQPWTDRYTWRLLSLVRRVQAHVRLQQRPPVRPAPTVLAVSPGEANSSIVERDPLLSARPAVRWANRQSQQPPLAHLAPSELRSLFRALARRRQAWQRGACRWQDLRDTVALALQLGAGIGPTDLRALQIQDLRLEPTADELLNHPGSKRPWPDQPPGSTPRRRRNSPAATLLPPTLFVLDVPANGSAAAYRAPVAPWASRLLNDWLQCRAALGLPGPCLFPSTRSGKPWGKVAQYEAAARVLTDAKVPAQAAGGSFRLRHSFALRQLALGHEPDQVARWLGVHDPGVMQRYLRSIASMNPAPANPDLTDRD